MDLIKKYFPNLTSLQLKQLEQLQPLYLDWNEKVNIISRKDVEHFYERHVLHSLSIAKIHSFEAGTKVLDLGTGGGFPGIPLAILFPETQFLLVDSIGKKISVVQDVIQQLGLQNAEARWSRVEEIDTKFDVVVTRAVAKLEQLLIWTKFHSKHIIALKGGDLSQEIKDISNIKKTLHLYPISEFFEEDFFETKFIVDLKKA
jgi:16S rRNA (guanine527-N7)-methyltransferase